MSREAAAYDPIARVYGVVCQVVREYAHRQEDVLPALERAGFVQTEVLSSERDLHVARDPGRNFYRCRLGGDEP